MTLRQAVRTLRSFYFRQRLVEDLPVLETELLEFVEETGIQALAGFKVEVDDGHVKVTKVHINVNQLCFEFTRKEF